ncbi:hypothetical protein BKA65DRAFT_539953 [Rhexocercosporidium sp. MPI-PUGE-AT-0058]|nr:hypothetical protein BKA65DRAFT_539953 [Rhexocercosporidium sp. MPI-PUGE-AT-0058]
MDLLPSGNEFGSVRTRRRHEHSFKGTAPMSLDMDFFDWPQLAENFGEDNLSAVLENLSVPETNDVASLAWIDYFTPPNTPALTQRSGSSFSSTQDSCQCQESGEGSQNDIAEEEDETVGSVRSTGRPRTPLHSGRDPVLNRIQRIYRQRRMEERQRFEERAIAAEEASKQLRLHLTELHSVIACLRYQVQQLEAEKAILKGNQ